MQILYVYHKQQCKEKTFTLLYDSRFATHFDSEYIELLEFCMSQTDLSGLKIILNVVSTDFQNNCGHPIMALTLNESFELPNGVD
jgi:hypothetical protein